MQELSGIFKPDAKTVMQIFCNVDSYYRIPDYQRPYSWGDEQIEQLWDDIYSALESGDETYFLGPMILIRGSEEYFEVVDGQQRLTTLTILFCVIRDLYLERLKASDEELANEVCDAIKSLVKGKYRLKLITQLYYQNQFEQEILNGVKFPKGELTAKQKKENAFINAALIFRKKLEELENKYGIDQIVKFTRYLLNRVVMITITCSKQDYAIKLFQVLNTRGLDLSHADLIKSSLYARLDDEVKRGQFISTLREVETLSKRINESLTDLFTYYEYYLLARNPKKSLYEELEAQFKNKEPNNVIYDFKRFVELFADIYSLENKLIYSFWYLPNQVFWKAILTTAVKEWGNPSSDFLKLCRELRKLYYSYWIAGYTTSKIKQLSFNLIGWIKDKKPLNDIVSKIDEKMKEDKVLEKMRENLNDEVYGESWLKPLLALIEYEQIEDSKSIRFIDLDRNVHVDHVLPQEWEKIDDWRRLWRDEKRRSTGCID